MGDPRKLRNKYSKPKKLLDKVRLAEESALKRTYGLKNMREIWIAVSELKKARREARRLLSLTEAQRKKEEGVVLTKLRRLGIIEDKASVEDILSLTVKDVLERRLQTRVLRKGLAKTMAQSRQLITHGFISVKDRIVNIPSYMVSAAEEGTLRHSKHIELEFKFEPKPEAKEATAEAKPEEKPKE
ncbi:MAG: 30S ribosomal protein S4 [Candidatus ainarchaeum sp.]|nr:30S ribosomal protein S4 [Candidatus ainarchaeum sp.]